MKSCSVNKITHRYHWYSCLKERIKKLLFQYTSRDNDEELYLSLCFFIQIL